MKKNIVNLYKSGMGSYEIASQYKMSQTRVAKILQKEGFKTNNKHGKEIGDKIQKLYEDSGLSIKDIAKKFKLESKVIRRFREERGFQKKVPVNVKTKSSKGRTRMESLISRYGEEEAKIRFKRSQKLYSDAVKGKKNPMYGKPSPMGAGYGIKGWHKGRFFRSLRELSFMLNYIDRFNLKNENLEKHKYRISYVDPMGVDKTYAGDFLINDQFFVEIKPKKLWESPSVKAKAEAGIKFCKEQGWKYKLIDPIVKNEQVVEEYLAGNIKFNEKSLEKFLEFNNLESSTV